MEWNKQIEAISTATVIGAFGASGKTRDFNPKCCLL